MPTRSVKRPGSPTCDRNPPKKEDEVEEERGFGPNTGARARHCDDDGGTGHEGWHTRRRKERARKVARGLADHLWADVERRRGEDNVSVLQGRDERRALGRGRAADGGGGVAAAVRDRPRHAVQIQRAHPAVDLVPQSISTAAFHFGRDAGARETAREEREEEERGRRGGGQGEGASERGHRASGRGSGSGRGRGEGRGRAFGTVVDTWRERSSFERRPKSQQGTVVCLSRT